MPEQKINLEKIFDINYDHKTMISRSVMSKEKFIEVCLEFGKQLLELAADNAEMEFIPFNDNQRNFNGVTIDKQSILNTIKQVEI